MNKEYRVYNLDLDRQIKQRKRQILNRRKRKWLYSIAVVIVAVLALCLMNIDCVIEFENVKESKRQFELVGYREVTSYTLGRVAETDDNPCIGAFNDNLCELAVTQNVCASNEFPKGTKLLVGDIECIVMDRMNSRYQYRIDLASLSYDSAIKFGRKNLEIYKIEEI